MFSVGFSVSSARLYSQEICHFIYIDKCRSLSVHLKLLAKLNQCNYTNTSPFSCDEFLKLSNIYLCLLWTCYGKAGSCLPMVSSLQCRTLIKLNALPTK